MLRKGGRGAAAGAPRETSNDVALDFTWRGDSFAFSFAMQAASEPGAGRPGRRGPPPPSPVLSGHAASLIPY